MGVLGVFSGRKKEKTSPEHSPGVEAPVTGGGRRVGRGKGGKRIDPGSEQGTTDGMHRLNLSIPFLHP